MLFYPPTKNGTQKTLDSQLDAGVTASATLNNVTSIQNKPGVIVINRVDANGNELPAASREYIKYTGTSGSTLTTLTRNVDGSTTDQDHAVGSIVEFIPDVTWAEGIVGALENLVTPSTGAVDPAKILPTSYLDTDTSLTANSDTKIATQKATKAYAMPISYLDTDGTLAANSDTKVSTQKAVKTYVDANSGSTDGWTAASGTWTYASASTITVPSGAASLYQRGDKIKFTQTTVKYAVIVTVADTLLTIAVNNDYTVANAAITLPYYSHVSYPMGFPSSFTYTPTYTFTAGAAPTGASNENAEYSINGGVLFVRSSKLYSSAGTTVTRCDISLPVTVSSNVANSIHSSAMSNAFAPVAVVCQTTTTTVQMFCSSATIDRLGFNIALEI